jgi:hypothetical protein
LDLKYGPGVAQAQRFDEFYDAWGSRVDGGAVGKRAATKREVVCRASHAVDGLCEALDHTRVGGQWIASPFGWSDYPLPVGSGGGGSGGGYPGAGAHVPGLAQDYDPVLLSGEYVTSTDRLATITSRNGRYFLVLNRGNVAVYHGSGLRDIVSGAEPVWQSHSFTDGADCYLVPFCVWLGCRFCFERQSPAIEDCCFCGPGGRSFAEAIPAMPCPQLERPMPLPSPDLLAP